MTHHPQDNLKNTENLLKGNPGDRKNEGALLRGVFESGPDSVQIIKDLAVLGADRLKNVSRHEREEHYKQLMHDLNKVCQEHLFEDKHMHVIGLSLKNGERGLMVEDEKGNVMRMDMDGNGEVIGRHDAKGHFLPARHDAHATNTHKRTSNDSQSSPPRAHDEDAPRSGRAHRSAPPPTRPTEY